MSTTDPLSYLLQVRRRPFDKDSFISNVCQNKYVLVIGSEVILDKEKYEADNGDIQQYILNRLNQALGRDMNPYPNLNALVSSRPEYSTPDDISGADLIRNLLIPPTDSEEDNTENGSYITVDDLSPELIGLLGTRLFRFVMTTSIDSNVEFIMRSIWKEQLRVVNFADKADWKTFQKEIEETLDGSVKTQTVYNYTRPTLIYVFGKVSRDPYGRFMKTENDAIEFIDLWMNRNNDPFTAIIKDKRILALGCKFDDWYFRFFWFILKRDFTKLGEGEVALSFDSGNPEDQKLKHYLERKHVYIHDDARKFMQLICNMLTPDENNPDSRAFHEIIKSKRGIGEVFLSYCSQDFILASQIFFRLTNLGYSVWFDNEKLCGGNYESDIRQAIHKARVVITLLTPNIQEDLENGITTRFYQKEWRMATETGAERIIPLAADGYSLRGAYHSRKKGDATVLATYEEIIGSPIDGIDLMTESFDKLVNAINKKK